MKREYPYLNNSIFLKQLVNLHIKEYFVKITVLSWIEKPIQNIEGRVISANINIDGQSIIRRTATLSIVIDDLINDITNIENLLSINKKINLQIGFLNTTQQYQDYDYLWFPLGVYVVTSNSISHSDTGLVASLQLKDKMCLLNGECGGTIPAATVFDNYQTIDENGNWVIERPTIYQIITELVNHFGGEQLGKIIISDLDKRIKQVMQWTGNSPLYFIHNPKENQYLMTVNEEQYRTNINKELEEDKYYDIQGSPFQYGNDVGYILTDFTYPGDLIGDAGATVTDILEQIKTVLGNYEYFYDIDGNFVFQQIKNYLNNSQSKYILDVINGNNSYFIDANGGGSVFEFSDSNLISSFSNTPQYSKIKNDYIVWGIKTLSDERQIPIRYHLAIDKKPKPGNVYQAFEYEDPDDNIKKWHCPIKLNKFDEFPKTGAAGTFYMDLSNDKIYKWEASDDPNVKHGYQEVAIGLKKIRTTDWRTQLYFQGVVTEPYGTESNYYYTQLLEEWPKIYDIAYKKEENSDIWIGQFKQQTLNKAEEIEYYLDFIDSQAEISQFSIDNIGRRTIVLNEDKNVNCVFQPQIPDIVLINIAAQNDSLPGKIRIECDQKHQAYYQVPSVIYDSLEVGGNLNSAYQVIRQLLHEYTSYNESISLQTLPIYFLEPNTRISVHDIKSNIHGDYMINSLSFTLDTSSLLTINATKALSKI